MTALTWDGVGTRFYETGVSKGVLYIPDSAGVYSTGFAWNGLTAITEKPSGATANPQFADNMKWLNLISVEEFMADIDALTYPDQFAQCDGSAEPVAGVRIGQQTRKPFGLAYNTLMGNDLSGTDLGYKIHLVWGALAAPSQKAHKSVNDKPEAMPFQWSLTTTPMTVPGYKPTASMVIDSTKVDPTKLASLESLLYGSTGANPQLPTPAAVISLIQGTLTTVSPVAPTYVQGTHTITIPTVTGVVYTINGQVVAAGAVIITTDTIVAARPAVGYAFPQVTDNDWLYVF
jgi:hypothetical protein